MSDITDVFLYLMGCALNGTAPAEEHLAGINWEQLYKLAMNHSVVSMLGYAVEKTVAFSQASPETVKAWRVAKEKAVRKTLLFDTERASLLADLEKQGIWYLPLKGIVAKDYYPRYGMREMSDNDILFDPEKRAEVREIFRSHGYSVKSYNSSHHDAYEKPPVLRFEMHAMPYNPYYYPKLAAYYDHIREMLIRDDGSACGCHFSDEDFYVFMISHAGKHYGAGGTGIRTLADLYILHQRLGKTLDRAAVDKALSAMDLLDFEREARSLAEHLFARPALLSDCGLSDRELAELDRYLGTTVHGSLDARMKSRMNIPEDAAGKVTLRAKADYLRRLLFPGREFCRITCPVVYRHPVLLPFYWIWRILFKAPKKLPALKRQYRALKHMK